MQIAQFKDDPTAPAAAQSSHPAVHPNPLPPPREAAGRGGGPAGAVQEGMEPPTVDEHLPDAIE